MSILRSFIQRIGMLDRHRIIMFLAVVGPGIIAATAGNDAPGIATYTTAGAHYGYGLLWVLVPMALSLAVIQEMAARMGVVTGKGLGDLVRERFGVRLTLFIMLLLIAANLLVTIAEFAGVAAALELVGVHRVMSVPLAALFVWALVVKGKYRHIEKVFLFLCSIYLTYAVSGIMAEPPWGRVMKMMVTPSFVMEAGYINLVIAMVGTTITPWMQFLLQSSAADKGIEVSDYGYTRTETVLGAFASVFIVFFIMVAAAATLHAGGVMVETAEEAAVALRPLAGNYAYILFTVGLLNASLLGASILPLSTSYAVSEAFGWESGMDKDWDEAPQFLGLYTGLIVAGALVAMIPGLSLISFMIISQTANGIILPIILILMLKLVNDPEIMGSHVNGPGFNVIARLTAAFLIVMTALLLLTTLLPNIF